MNIFKHYSKIMMIIITASSSSVLLGGEAARAFATAILQAGEPRSGSAAVGLAVGAGIVGAGVKKAFDWYKQREQFKNDWLDAEQELEDTEKNLGNMLTVADQQHKRLEEAYLKAHKERANAEIAAHQQAREQAYIREQHAKAQEALKIEAEERMRALDAAMRERHVRERAVWFSQAQQRESEMAEERAAVERERDHEKANCELLEDGLKQQQENYEHQLQVLREAVRKRIKEDRANVQKYFEALIKRFEERLGAAEDRNAQLEEENRVYMNHQKMIENIHEQELRDVQERAEQEKAKALDELQKKMEAAGRIQFAPLNKQGHAFDEMARAEIERLKQIHEEELKKLDEERLAAIAGYKRKAMKADALARTVDNLEAQLKQCRKQRRDDENKEWMAWAQEISRRDGASSSSSSSASLIEKREETKRSGPADASQERESQAATTASQSSSRSSSSSSSSAASSAGGYLSSLASRAMQAITRASLE